MQHDKRIAATVKEAMTRRENELQASNATHGELSAQIEDLKREYNELNAEMDKLYDHEQAQGAELQKYKEDVKVWKAKFRKVEKVVEHLNEERDALISDADTTDKQRECLQLQIGLLEQRLEDGRHCMEEGKNLLNVERERNGSLEAKLLQISEDQQSILVSRQEAAVKLDQLLEAHKASSEQSNSIPDQKGIAMAQDRCINMLMELQNAPVVASEDIQKLDRGIGAYAEWLVNL
jgi:chromosome segregation ATPase